MQVSFSQGLASCVLGHRVADLHKTTQIQLQRDWRYLVHNKKQIHVALNDLPP